MNIFDAIKEQVSIFDMCDLAGVKYNTKLDSHKVFCPFHDDTTTKSGYIYHDTDTFRCFVCARNWDVIDFWAQHNEWYRETKTGEQALDVGKAIADLKTRFGIEVVQPTWEQKYFALRNEEPAPTGYDGYDMTQRIKLRDYYAWKVQLRLRELPKEARVELWGRVQRLWDELDQVDLEANGWKAHLNSWRSRAKIGS